MFTSTREIKWAIVSAALTLVLVGAFQNCAPSLPDNEVRQLGGASVRPTPLPASTPLPALGDTIYGALPWEGTCTNDFATEDMAVPGLDILLAPLMVYRRATDNSVALWNFNYQKVQRGVVCKMNQPGWTVMGTGDFNGDGHTDIIWRNADTRTAIWLLRGSTRINGGFSTNQASVWKLEATADFNGDGKHDIFWRNSSTHQGQIWYMNGITVTASNPLIDPNGAMLPIPTDYRILGTGDFNADKKGDVLLRNNAGEIRIWSMDGAKINAVVIPSQANVSGYEFLCIGDFDADTKADIAWKNTAANTIINWKMDNGTRTEGTPAGLNNAVGWVFDSCVDATGDFRADFLWSIPNAQFGLPTLGITPVSVNPNTGGTVTYNPVRTGWAPFKFDRY